MSPAASPTSARAAHISSPASPWGSLASLLWHVFWYFTVAVLLMTVLTIVMAYLIYRRYLRHVVKSVKDKQKPPAPFWGSKASRQLLRSLAIDAVGAVVAIYPGLGVFWAPLSAAAIYYQYESLNAAVAGFCESVIPILGATPMATITWLKVNYVLVIHWGSWVYHLYKLNGVIKALQALLLHNQKEK